MDTQQIEIQKPKNYNWIYMLVIALLLGAVAYLYITKNKTETANTDLNNLVTTVSNDKATIETEYNAALARLDEMKNESVQMDSLLTTKSSEVDELKAKIKSILDNKNATQAQLKEATGLIAQLKTKMTSYEQQIVALKQENVQLTEDKKQLTEDKNEITKERENLKEDKKTLEKTVEVGSVLHASSIKMVVINKHKNLLGKEKEKETSKASKADLIRISFDLDDNRISESGEKIIYICVYAPNGNVISSGNTKIKLADNSEKTYTIAKTIPYKQGEKSKDISTDWSPLDEFSEGNYKVEIYHMGYKIGRETVTLK